MTDKEFSELRRVAEARTRAFANQRLDLTNMAPEQIHQLVHELDVHRIELEMQNDELRKTQSHLETARDRYSSLFDLAPVAYFVVDSKGQILEGNRSGASLLGLAYDDLQQHKLQEFVVEADQDHFFSHLRHLFAGHRHERCEIEMIRPSGTRLFAHIEGGVLLDEQLTYNQCLIAVVDITERRQIEQALEAADQRKNEFIATLSHELRNPLAPIRYAVEILKLQETSGNPTNSALQIIDRQVDQMVSLIDDLMDVGRITRGRLDVNRRRMALAPVIEQALEMFRPLLADKRQDLSVFLPPYAIYADLDAARMAQALVNILNNASKFSDEGGRIELSVHCSEGQAVLSIRDNGIGIEPEHLTHLFDAFSFVGNQHYTTRSGLGIGLSLARSLVEMHDGSITAYSEGSGSGTEFVIRLPANCDPAEAIDTPAVAPAERPAVRSAHILVVDDNPDIVASVTLLLELQGHRVDKACDGAEALRLAATNRPEVLLLDIGMPELDGFEVCRSIRSQPWGNGIVIVALTGWGQADDRRRTEEAGFDAHLVKPVEPGALAALLSERLPPTR